MSQIYHKEVKGVPTLFIDDKVFIGYSSSIGETIKQEIKRCSNENCANPLDRVRP